MKLITNSIRANSIKVFGVSMAASLAMAASAQSPISIINPGFSDSADSNSGFDSPGNDVPGWGNFGTIYNASGVTSANWFQNNTPPLAFETTGDDGAGQITSYAIQSLDQFTLTWDAVNVSGANDQTVFLFSMSPSSVFSYLGIFSSSVSSAESQYTISYTATAADQGNFIGIGFTAPTGGGTVGYDNFALNVTPVPEPSTMALIAFGALGLVFLRRRNVA